MTEGNSEEEAYKEAEVVRRLAKIEAGREGRPVEGNDYETASAAIDMARIVNPKLIERIIAESGLMLEQLQAIDPKQKDEFETILQEVLIDFGGRVHTRAKLIKDRVRQGEISKQDGLQEAMIQAHDLALKMADTLRSDARIQRIIAANPSAESIISAPGIEDFEKILRDIFDSSL
jgi:hypothetical protein